MSEFIHIPILAKEISDLLITDRDGIYLDGTLGLGGHSGILLKNLSDKGRIIGLDKDIKAIAMAKENVSDSRLITFNLSYTYAAEALKRAGVNGVNGALFDLGLSSYQLDDASRGFSFLREGPLDMRFDTAQTLTAKEVINTYSADKLEKIFELYGEERNASKIALAICAARRQVPIQTTAALAQIVQSVSPRVGKNHPATKIFQALRIEVNGELDCVKNIGALLKNILFKGGRGAVLTFHSTEDRIIKFAFKELCTSGNFVLVNKKVIEPCFEEIKSNSRARSAKLRVIERVK